MSELRIQPSTKAQKPVQTEEENRFDRLDSKITVATIARKVANAFSFWSQNIFRMVQDYIYGKESPDQAHPEKQQPDSRLKKALNYITAHKEELALFSIGAIAGCVTARYMVKTDITDISKTKLDQKILPLSPIPSMYSTPIGPKESWNHSLEALYGTCPAPETCPIPDLGTCSSPSFLSQIGLPAPSISNAVAKTKSVAANTCPVQRLALPAPQLKLPAPERLALPAPQLKLPAPAERLALSAPQLKLPAPERLALPAPQLKLPAPAERLALSAPQLKLPAPERLALPAPQLKLPAPAEQLALPAPELTPSFFEKYFSQIKTPISALPAPSISNIIPNDTSVIGSKTGPTPHSVLPTPANATEVTSPSLLAKLFSGAKTNSTLPPVPKIIVETTSIPAQSASHVSQSVLPAPANATEITTPPLFEKPLSLAQPIAAASILIAKITSAASDCISSLFKKSVPSAASEERVIQQAVPHVVDQTTSIIPNLFSCVIPRFSSLSSGVSEECVAKLLKK